jgi:hypothetical protein
MFTKINSNLLTLNKELNKVFTLKPQLIPGNNIPQFNLNYKKTVKGFLGKELNSQNQQLYFSKNTTYSFNEKNNHLSLISSTKAIDLFLKKAFLSIGSLISKPSYINNQNKIIIKLFVYFSPKLDRFFKTSLVNKNNWLFLNEEQNLLGSKITPMYSISQNKGIKKSILRSETRRAETSTNNKNNLLPLSTNSLSLSETQKVGKDITVKEFLSKLIEKKETYGQKAFSNSKNIRK